MLNFKILKDVVWWISDNLKFAFKKLNSGIMQIPVEAKFNENMHYNKDRAP